MEEKPPKILLTFVEAEGKRDKTISLEDLQKEHQEAEARRKAIEGEGKSCRCAWEFRDPECKQKYPVSCPWNDFHKANLSDTPKPSN